MGRRPWQIHPSDRTTWLQRAALTLLVNLLALLLTWGGLPFIERSVFIFFFAAVAITAWYAGMLPAIMTIMVGVLAIGLFVIPPIGSLNVGIAGAIPLLVFTAVASLITGLTEAHRRAEVAARAAGERFRVTLASIGDGVIVTDTAACITFMNAVAEALTGWSASMAGGRPSEEILSLRDETTEAAIELPIARVLRTGQSSALVNHTWVINRDGTRRPIANSAAPILATTGEILGVVMVFRDMSERVQADLARAELLAQAQAARERAERALETRDHFLMLAAHELNTPLTTVIGNIQLLQRRVTRAATLDEREHRILQVVSEQTERLHTLVRSLLDVSRIVAGQLSIERAPMDIVALVTRVVTDTRLGQPTNRLHLSTASTPILIAGDAVRLEQVLLNLIQNALKYSAAATAITVRVERRDTTVAIVVADHGIGIPTEALPRLFERFYRASNTTEHAISGLGIGLTVVHDIVTLHSGWVQVESVESRGSTFTVILPILDARDPSTTSNAP